jgi:hypothetical protein
MSRASAFALCALFAQGLPGQGLDDRRVGLFFDYTVGNAQDPGNLSGRLSFGEGGGMGVYVALTKWLRWDADLTVTGNDGIFGEGMVYGFTGPEFTKRVGRTTLFAHALFGAGETQDNGVFAPFRSGFAMAYGGGGDVRLNSRLSLRAIQVDALPSHFSGRTGFDLFGPLTPEVTNWATNLRVSFGLIVKFGHNPQN